MDATTIRLLDDPTISKALDQMNLPPARRALVVSLLAYAYSIGAADAARELGTALHTQGGPIS